MAVVLRNGIVIGSARVDVEGSIEGTWAYTLASVDAQGRHWLRLPLSSDRSVADPVPRREWQRYHAADEFKQAVAGIVEPGATIVVTEDSIRSGALPKPAALIEGAADNHR
jgi:hypothetical protein